VLATIITSLLKKSAKPSKRKFEGFFMPSVYELVIAFVLGFPIMLGFYFGFALVNHWIKRSALEIKHLDRRRAVENHNLATRFPYDQNGNPLPYFNPRTGDTFIPAIGNSAHPPFVYVQQGGQKEIKPTRGNDNPIVIWANRPQPGTEEGAARIIQNPFLQSPLTDNDGVQDLPTNVQSLALNGSFEPERSERQSNVRSVEDILALMREAKERGEGKQRTIKMLTGFNPGGSPGWLDWSSRWDNNVWELLPPATTNNTEAQ
jgi:hypothetical protein